MRGAIGKIIPLVLYSFSTDVAVIRSRSVIRATPANILGQKNPTLGSSVNSAVITLKDGIENELLCLESQYAIDFKLEGLAAATSTGLGLIGQSAFRAVAGAGTTQAGAGALAGEINNISASAGQVAVVLPAITPLKAVWVINNSAVTISIFPGTGDTISGSAQNAAVTLAPGAQACFYSKSTAVAASATLGLWYQIQ